MLAPTLHPSVLYRPARLGPAVWPGPALSIDRKPHSTSVAYEPTHPAPITINSTLLLATFMSFRRCSSQETEPPRARLPGRPEHRAADHPERHEIEARTVFVVQRLRNVTLDLTRLRLCCETEVAKPDC
jgi:hypothetical protein